MPAPAADALAHRVNDDPPRSPAHRVTPRAGPGVGSAQQGHQPYSLPLHGTSGVALGISGSGAATVAAQLVADASGYGRRGTVVATSTSAALFLPDLSVPVHTGTDWTGRPDDPLHIRLLEDVNWFVVAPTTATTLARAAAGLADTLLGALVLAHGPGVYFQPSMNQRTSSRSVCQNRLGTAQPPAACSGRRLWVAVGGSVIRRRGRIRRSAVSRATTMEHAARRHQ